MADDSPYIGMTTEQIREAQRAEREAQTPEPAPEPVPVNPPPRAPEVEPPTPDEPIIPGFGVEFMPPAPGFEEAPGVYGRPVDEPALTMDLRDRLVELEGDLYERYVLDDNMDPSRAREKARKDILDILKARVSPDGQPTTQGFGIGQALEYVGLPPFFRESKVDFSANPPVVKETGEPATPEQMRRESMARQVVMTPEDVARARQVRGLERELALEEIPGSLLYTDEYARDVRSAIAQQAEPYFTGVLSDIEPGTAEAIETPLGAAVRSSGIVSTIVNEALMGLPLTYDIDEQGNPVDTDQFAFKVNDFLVRSAERMGVPSEEARDIFSGTIGPTGIPVPFQGIRRGGPTALDPLGKRGASETETFMGDWATSLAKGRFLGDELYSMPAYVQDLAEAAFINNTDTMGTGERLQLEDESLIGQSALYYPMVLGAGLEMVYGIGPISAVGKTARVTGRATRAASMAAALKTAEAAGEAALTGKPAKAAALMKAAEGFEAGAKAGQWVAHPVETSKRIKLIRAAQDLLDEGDGVRPEFDVLMDRAEVKRVMGDLVSKDVVTPYLIAGRIRAGNATVGDLRQMAGDSSSGQEFLRQLGIDARYPDDAPWGAGRLTNDAVEPALLQYRYNAHKPEIDAILRSNLPDADKAARIYDLLSDLGVDRLANKPIDQRRALEAVIPGGPGRLRGLAEAAAGNGTTADALAALDLQVNRKYLPVSPDAPAMQMLHDFGQQVYTHGRRIGEEEAQVPLRGPAAESFTRRLELGTERTVPTQAGVVEETVHHAYRTKPEKLREAAIGAGGRVIESTFENLVPEDLVFVTDTLMVPRQGLTPAVRSQVRQTMTPIFEKVRAVPTPALNGQRAVGFVWDVDPDDVGRLFGGVEAIRRSPMKESIFLSVSKGAPLTASQHHFLQDAFLSDAYRRAMGRDAVEAVLAGPQTQQARQPTVGLGLLTAAGTDVETRPRQARGLAEAREPSFLSVIPQGIAITRNTIGSGVRAASKRFPKVKYTKTKFKGQTPFGLEATEQRVRERVSAIPDNFQQEVRNAAAVAANPEAAFASIIQKRVNANAEAAIEVLSRQAQRLMESGMSEAEAYSTLAYQQRVGVGEAEALGEQIARTGVVPDARGIAERFARESAVESAWQSTLKAFFGPSIYGQLLAPTDNALYPYIKVGENYRPLTPEQFRAVLGLIRDDNPELVARGLARAKFPGAIAMSGALQWFDNPDPRNLGKIRLVDDAVVDTLSGWAMGADRQRIVQEEATRLLDTDPYIRTDLFPSSHAAGRDRIMQEREAVMGARYNVNSALGRLSVPGDAPPYTRTLMGMLGGIADFRQEFSGLSSGRRPVDSRVAERVQRPGTPFIVPVEPGTAKVGKYSARLDNLTVREYRNLNAGARRDLVRYVYGKMLEEGRSTPDLRVLLSENLDDPQLNLLFFEKQATTQSLLRLLGDMDAEFERVLRANQGTPMSKEVVDDLLEQAFPSRDDRALYRMILEAKRGTDTLGRPITKQQIAVSMRRALLQNAVDEFIEPTVTEMQANARAYGWTPDLDATREGIVTLVDQVNPMDPRFAVAGQDFVDAVSGLQAASKDGKLAENLDALQKSDRLARALKGDRRAAGEYALQVASEALTTPRTMAAAGLLAGGYYLQNTGATTPDGTPIVLPVPLPNTRYIGTNLITAPLIAATTLGTTGAIRLMPGTTGVTRQAGEVARQAGAQALPAFLNRPLFNSLEASAPDAVMFESRLGRQWTRGEFEQAVADHNINITRGGVEFANAFAQDLARDARLTAEGVKAPALRQYLLRNLDPTRTGFWQYFANATDRAFRQNVFASALKEGMPPEQAAQLARNVVLDYGNVKYTRGLNKYVMFLAFRESMTREVIEAMARDPDSLNRTILLHRDLQKQMDDEMGADHSKFRLPIGGVSIFDQTAPARNYGPINPALDMYGDLVRFAAMGLQAGATDIPPGTVAQAVADESLTPLVAVAMADALARPSIGGKGQKVDDVWVAYALQNGPDTLWPWLKDRYNIIPIRRTEERRAGRLEAVDPEFPTLGRTEFRFETPTDHKRFVRDMAMLQILGFERTTMDYSKMGLTYGVEDFIDPKRRGLPTTFGFATGLETPIGVGDQMSAAQRALRQQETRARAKQPRE